jgi:activator of HSP90 ATPase
MLSTTANWHWKNKNVTSWAKTWFQDELTKIVIQGEGSERVSISSVSSVEGDVELGQRKSKWVSLFGRSRPLGLIMHPQVNHDLRLQNLSGVERHCQRWY